MNQLNHFYRLFRALSLDIVIGAVLVSMLIARHLNLEVPVLIYLTLAVAVWLIYTWDHLSDAAGIDNPSTFRHQFHKRYYKVLLGLIVVCLIFGAILVFYLPIQTVYFGVAAAALVMVYFLLVRFWDGFVYKEIVSALLYSLGVFVGPLSLYQEFSLFIILMYFQILVIALMNLMIFSLFEDKTDKADGFVSLILLLGDRSKLVINILFFISITITLSLFFLFELPTSTATLFAIMSATLFVINLNQKFFHSFERYRIVGDGIFYLPLFVLV
ncbi:MAG: hypothetical protein NXI20_15195 [bacterium]|nr:hypothetical protein [bacterium]